MGGEVGKCKSHFAALRVTSINLHYVNKCNLHFLTFLDIFDITPPKSRRGLKNVTYIMSTNVTYIMSTNVTNICWRHANCDFFGFLQWFSWFLQWFYDVIWILCWFFKNVSWCEWPSETLGFTVVKHKTNKSRYELSRMMDKEASRNE